MTRLVTLLEKRADLTAEEFTDHWMDEHVPLAKQLPGLERYSTVVPEDLEESAYDGVAILDFADEAALDAAFESPEGERTTDDLDTFVASVTRVIGPETVHLDER